MNLKKVIISSLVLILSAFAFAQQDQHYSQYMFNGLVINPAYAGSNGMISAGIFHRTQWVGFDGHPVTQSFSIHSPVLHESVGVGLHILNDKIGALKNTSISTSYAYRINIAKGVLSMGLQGGLMNYSLDNSTRVVKDADDQRLNNYSTMKPDLGFGTYYLKKNYYVGFSVPHLIQTSLNDKTLTNADGTTVNDFSQLTRHYFITGAYQYYINRDFAVIPSIMYKTLRFSPKFKGNDKNYQTSSLDLTTHFKYQNTVWLGFTYRMADSFNAQVGADVSKFVKSMEQSLKIGYAFDLTTSGLKSYNSGTHEIMLIFDFEVNPKAKSIDKDIHYISPRLF